MSRFAVVTFLAVSMMLLGVNVSCGKGRDDNFAKPSITASPSQTPVVLADLMQLAGELIAGAAIPFRVDFALTSDDVPEGTVVWRQWNGARRLDFSLLAPKPRGGFEIESNFSDKGVPRDGVACNWIASDAGLLEVNCGVPLDAGDVADDLRATVSLGAIDSRLPSRSILGIAAQCFGVKRTVLSPGGEVCVDPTQRVPLYYANESGAVLTASNYAASLEASRFSSDLVARLPASAVAVLRSDLELP